MRLRSQALVLESEVTEHGRTPSVDGGARGRSARRHWPIAIRPSRSEGPSCERQETAGRL